MDMEIALRARIIAAATPAGSRVYWEDRPQGAALPAVVLHNINDRRAQHLKGFDMKEAVVQADVMALSFAAKKALKEAVIVAIAPAATTDGIQFMRATEIYAVMKNERTETQFIYADAINFTIRWSDTAS